ncbi:MAG TPA: trigger factor, partial [Myxococcota bacterium]|nr:trigger factor [Myxococcota bacterium]
MHIDVKSDNAYTRRVDIRYPAKFVQDELVRAFKKLGERARIPGFRPGKVPMGVLEARYGDKVREDVAAALIQRGWTRALNSQQLEPVSRPTVTRQDEIAGGRDFSFTIALEVRPTIDAVSYKGLPVTWPAWQVGEDEISRFIDGQRREQARLAPVEGRAARAGDIVQVSLVARDGDAVVLDEPGTLVRTSNDAWLPGIEHLVVGLSVDEERTGTAHIGAEARHKDLAGRSLDVTVKALAIQEYVVPELDDALAKELGHADVEAYRASVRERLGRGREDWARNMARANLLQALIEANPFEVPASMVEQNLQLLQEELKMQQAYAGRDARSITFTPAQIADLRNRAAFAAKGGLLIESVARQETITTSDADVEAKIVELAASRGQNLESMRAYFSKPEELADLRDRIKEEKTLDWLLSVAVVEQ